MTPKPTSEYDLRKRPLTLGVLVAIAMGAVALIGMVYRSETHVQTVAKEVVKHHCEKDVDQAHPDLPAKYTTQIVHERTMGEIKQRLGRIEWSQQTIKTTLDKMERRSRRGR